MSQEQSLLKEPADFSLVLGGPLYQFFLRLHLGTPALDLLRRRIIAIAAIAWLPLLLLTVFDGQFAGNASVPFLLDLDAHVRFLACLPLLIAAELIVNQRIRVTVRQFIDRRIIAPEDRPQFEEIIASTMRLRNSVLVELFLVVFTFTAAHWVWRGQVSMSVATWYAAEIDGQMQLSPAGYWYAFVSLPLVRFIAFRWWFRWLLWFWFLWKVSRLPLRLNALHPDRAGGLAFVSGSVFAFAPVLIAHTVLLAGVIGNRIWHEGARLPDFKLEIAGILAGLVLFALAPLTVFFFHLASTKRAGVCDYGVLASRYVNEFSQKWGETGPDGEPLLGTADIQTLADLSNSFEVVREMRALPFSRQTVLQLVIMLALPLFPLTLTMIPVEEMIDRLAGVLL